MKKFLFLLLLPFVGFGQFNPIFFASGNSQTSLIGTSYSGSGKCYGGVLAPNGKIYFTPYNSTQVLELDPSTNTTSLIGSVYSGTDKWAGGVLAPNGKIYFSPIDYNQVLELDPSTNTTSLIGSVYSGTAKWIGGVLAPNGKIYFTPFSKTQIMQLNRVNYPDVIGTDAQIPTPLSGLATSNYNKYYNKL